MKYEQCFLAGLLVVCVVFAENIVYPAAAGVVDVTQPPYSATGNGVTDDTEAIQKALSDYANGNRIIYLPNGVYKVSNTLRWGDGEHGGMAQKRTAMQGQSRDGTIIRLANDCTGFQDPANPKGVLWTGNKPAQRFRNSIWNLTVNTGRGNPGASGIQYNTSNQGSMRHVKIESEDRAGFAGLDVRFTGEIGPGFIYDLTVIGFDYGVNADALNSLTFQTLTLSQQNVCGIKNLYHPVSIRGLVSTNSVPAVNNAGVMMLMDVRLNGTGTAASVDAIVNSSSLYARSIETSGYRQAIANTTGTNTGAHGPAVNEFVSHSVQSLFPSGSMSLCLPVKDPPELPWDEVADWVSPMDFGAVGDGVADDTRALQAAIDAGKPTVCLPGGKSFKFTEITIRGKVRRLVGCQGNLRNGTIRFADGDEPVVALENFNALYYQITLRHESSRTLIVRSVSAVTIVGAGSGDLFLEDVCTSPFLFQNPAQHIWAWQLNPEGKTETNIVNSGATLWLMGLKTEMASTKLATSNGGFTEVLGGHIYAQGEPKTTPLFTIENASASFAAVRQISFNDRWFSDVVRETRGSDTRTLTRTEGGNILRLYAGYADGAVAATPAATLSRVARMAPATRLLLVRAGATAPGIVVRDNTKNAFDFSISGQARPRAGR